ncbi:unnamed protein product [Oikopleura dioica]|uniref:Piezo THU9 and anchor domain-containing protein n=1 Tax=Oikopleura dioica TaxID=34765 RepID=E4YYK4_OIKDI|nr:unnamed protein product [Oikopleura dioica]
MAYVNEMSATPELAKKHVKLPLNVNEQLAQKSLDKNEKKDSSISNDGSRFITEHFQRQHLNSALIKAIAVFLEPSWAELPDDYVFCTVVGTLKRIFLSLEKMTMYCSRCNLVFDENAHKEHVAKHHKELFDRTYGRMLVDEANDAEFCRIVNRSAIGRQLKDHILRNADYWIDMIFANEINDENTAREKKNMPTDMYIWMLGCDFICFIIIMFGYWAFGKHTIGQTLDITVQIKENTVPKSFLYLLITHFFLILVDRAIYLKKNLMAKLLFHFAQVLVIHIW